MTGSYYIGHYPKEGQAKNFKELMKPEGEFNHFRIQAKGDTFTCWINGKQASQYTNKKYTGAAPIAFQIHKNVKMTCEFKNIRIAKL